MMTGGLIVFAYCKYIDEEIINTVVLADIPLKLFMFSSYLALDWLDAGFSLIWIIYLKRIRRDFSRDLYLCKSINCVDFG